MSTSQDDASELSDRPTIFSSQEFMEFLAKQAGDISKLEVTTKSGDRISASFNASPGSDEAVFKSLDAMKSLLQSDDLKETPPEPAVSLAAAKTSAPAAANFTSRDWTIDYGKDHVDVTYDKCFQSGPGEASQEAGRIIRTAAPALPPKKRAGKTDWNALYSDALSPLVEAASLAQREPETEPPRAKNGKPYNSGTKLPKSPSNANTSTKSTKRKPRKVVPENKEYVDQYIEQDVLFGRGGRSNHHLGNKLYREKVIEKQDYYQTCDKNEKTKVAQSIVDGVHNDQRGRFLELCRDTGRYFIVPNIMARRKVGQALRENNTEEARAAKREKYGQGKDKKMEGSFAPMPLPATN